jgi:hypothetical protein
MNMDFGFMIKNHPEFFTKLSSRDHVPEPPDGGGGLFFQAAALSGRLFFKTTVRPGRLRSKRRPAGRRSRRNIKTKNISAYAHEKCKT